MLALTIIATVILSLFIIAFGAGAIEYERTHRVKDFYYGVICTILMAFVLAVMWVLYSKGV